MTSQVRLCASSVLKQYPVLALLIMLLFPFSFTAQANAAIYWGTIRGIARANLDGTLLDPEFIETGGICAIATDSSHIYWADHLNDVIGRANLDGTGVEQSFISGTGYLPCGLAVSSSYIYWPNKGDDTIGRAKLDGSEVDPSFIETAAHPCGVAISPTGIFWASDQEKKIWQTDISGINGPEVIVDKATEPCALALKDSHLFWADGYANTIGRVDLDGSKRIDNFIEGASYSASLATYENHLYWLNVAWGSESIGRADLDGTNVSQRFLGDLKYPYGLAVDSTVVVPSPEADPPRPSRFKIGKPRRTRDGSVFFPVDLFGEGLLEVDARGVRVEILPEGKAKSNVLRAGRKWLKVTPAANAGYGSRCVLRVLRNGGEAKLMLRALFMEPGRNFVRKRRQFLIFKPSAQAANSQLREKRRAVNCFPPPWPPANTRMQGNFRDVLIQLSAAGQISR
jgi:virginiamycin B lyase